MQQVVCPRRPEGPRLVVNLVSRGRKARAQALRYRRARLVRDPAENPSLRICAEDAAEDAAMVVCP